MIKWQSAVNVGRNLMGIITGMPMYIEREKKYIVAGNVIEKILNIEKQRIILQQNKGVYYEQDFFNRKFCKGC